MVIDNKRKGIKEWLRKFMVSLKKRPQNIPLVCLLVTYIYYSLNLALFSNTTAVINKIPMGLCCFCIMLFSLLAMVTFLNAYPKREKVKVMMVVLFYVISAIVLLADVVYLIKINQGMVNADLEKNAFILDARKCVLNHMIFEGISVVLAATFPLYGKLFNKVNTSVDLGESTVSQIDVDNE